MISAAAASSTIDEVGKLTVLLYVQSCRGIGHLHRVGALATGLASKYRVVVVSGGPVVDGFEESLAVAAATASSSSSSSSSSSLSSPPSTAGGSTSGLCHDSFRFVQLPAVAAATGSESWKLVGCATGLPLDGDLKARRCAALLAVLKEEKPAAVIIEMFPFGRRRFHFELEPLLDACYETSYDQGGGGGGGSSGGPGRGERRYRPVLVSSVRDVLVKRASSEYDWAARKIRSHFDAVLVHGDEDIIPFDTTFPLASKIEEKLVYTGYVVRPWIDYRPQSDRDHGVDVLISAGGGGSGNVEGFYMTALRTATSLPALRFAIRVGPRVSQDLFDDLKKKAKAHHHVSLERNSLEFLKELSAAKVSISQGGYNSVMETVAMKMSGKAHPKRSVVVPIAEGPRKKDIEQELRARKFLEAGLVDYVILEEDLTVGTLVSTIKHAFSAIDSGGERESYDKAVLGDKVKVSKKVAEGKQLRCRMDGLNESRRAIENVINRFRSSRSSPGTSSRHDSTPLPISLASPGISPPSMLATGHASSSQVPPVTILLLNYKRPSNLRRILDDLTKQKPTPPDIFLWNNSGRTFVDERVTWQVDSSANRFCWPRWMMGSLARTRFICTMDDDFTFEDDFVLRDMVRWYDKECGHGLAASDGSRDGTTSGAKTVREQDGHTIVGFSGCVLHPNPKEVYQNGFHVNANKFAWGAAADLPWQDGIKYESSPPPPSCVASAAGAAAAAAAASSSAPSSSSAKRYLEKPWNSTPVWVWRAAVEEEKKQGSRKRKRSGGDIGEVKDGFASKIEQKGKGQCKRLQTNGSDKRATSVAVDIIKGRMMFLETTALRSVPFAFSNDDIRGDDIAISAMVAKGQRGRHRVLRCLDGRILELPAPHALCNAPGAGHYALRDSVCRRFFSIASKKELATLGEP